MKRFKISKIIHLTILCFLLSSCFYDNEETLYPTSFASCDTTAVTYSNTVSSILSSQCYSCHSNTTAANLGAGIKLENYSDAKKYADNGKLVGTIKYSPGFSGMPKSAAKMSDCNIKKIETWITNGTLND